MEKVTLKSIDYYNTVDIKANNPKIFYKCQTLRAIIDMQDLKENEYCYAYIKNKKWILSQKSYSNAKLLLTVACYNKLLKNVKTAKKQKAEEKEDDSDDESSDDEEEIKEAPKILKLKDSEKFKDNKGKILEIETRGVRDCDNCYFSAYDISKCFKMSQLRRVITHSDSGYKYNRDYVFFTVLDKKKHHMRSDKEMFLTVIGLQKLFYYSKNSNIQNSKLLIEKWIHLVFGNSIIIPDFVVIRNVSSKVYKYNYVYLINPDLMDAIKVGYWRNTIKSLKNRYMTYYGDDIEIFYVEVDDSPYVEKLFKQKFAKYNINHELYQKRYHVSYKRYLATHKV